MSSPTVQKMVTLNSEDVEWLGVAYSGAHLSWILTMLLSEFRKAHSLEPVDYAVIGAKALQGKIEDESV